MAKRAVRDNWGCKRALGKRPTARTAEDRRRMLRRWRLQGRKGTDCQRGVSDGSWHLRTLSRDRATVQRPTAAATAAWGSWTLESGSVWIQSRDSRRRRDGHRRGEGRGKQRRGGPDAVAQQGKNKGPKSEGELDVRRRGGDQQREGKKAKGGDGRASSSRCGHVSGEGGDGGQPPEGVGRRWSSRNGDEDGRGRGWGAGAAMVRAWLPGCPECSDKGKSEERRAQSGRADAGGAGGEGRGGQGPGRGDTDAGRRTERQV